MSSTPVVFSDQDIDQSGQSSKPITFGEDEIAKPSSGTALGDNPLGPGSVGYKAPAATRPQPRFTDVWYPQVSTEAQAGAARASSPRATASKAAGMPLADVAGAPHDPQLDVPTEYNPKTGMPFKPSLVPALDAPGFVPGANLERNVESAATELSRFRENDKPAYGVDPNNRFGPPVRILPEAEEERQRRQRLDAAAGLVDNAMNVAGPVTAPMIAASGPLSVLKAGAGIAAGYGASEGGGALIHGKVSPEEEHAIRTTLFFLPSAVGVVSGIRGGMTENPLQTGGRSALEGFGGKVQAGHMTLPDRIVGRVKVGGREVTVSVPRNGAPAPEGTPAAAPAAPLPAGVTSMVKANAAEAMAKNVIAGRPAVPPPPAPPPTPGEQFGNKLSGAQVDHLAKTIAEQPEAKRNGLIEEAHQNLTQWVADNKGKVIIDGKVHIAKTPDQAETLAAKLVNDAVAQHDKATAEAAKAQVKPESSQQPAKSSPEAPSKPAAEVKQFLASSRPPKAATPVQELQAPTPKPVQASLGNEAAVVPPEPQTTKNLPSNEVAKQEVAPPKVFSEKDIQPAHEYASTQVNIEPKSELGKRHAEAVASMADEHIGPNGKEETPHVTVRYGLKDDSPEAIEKIKAAAAKIAPFEATVGKTGSFPATKEGDRPIIAQVEKSPELNALRSAVEGAGEFKPDDHGEYKPHVTLGYVKPEHVAKYEGGNHLEGGKVPVDHIVVSKRDGTTESIPLAERRTNTTERKRVADMKPEEMARELHTSRLDNGNGTHTEMPIPNGRAFHDAPASPAVAMSDSDGLKAFNDKFGYKAGNAILVAKGEAAKEAGLDAYHQKGDEFLYHGESPEHLKAGLEKARDILRNREFTVTDATGKTVTLKGVDFSYGTGTDLATAESGLKAHKQQREASGERARGELRGITEVGHEAAAEGGSEAAAEVAPQTFHESDIEHELPEGIPARGKYGDVDIDKLTLAPKKFQYKLNTNEQGVTNLLHGQPFNPALADVVYIWHDPSDGKTYVVDGHHRTVRAREVGRKELHAYHIDVDNAGEARAIGALHNIALGRGTAIDAAKFFRDGGISPEDLSKHGISLGEAKAADGLALSKLDQSIFERVATGKMSEGRGVAIGQATTDPAQQEAIVKLLDKREKQGKNITDAMVAELARFVGNSGNRTIEQGGLFGANQQIHSLALEKAEISAHIKGQIAKERRVFGSVATEDKAAALGQVKGQKLKAEQNKKIADAAGQAEEAYNKLSSHAGPVNDILEKSAKELASGYHKPEDVKARAYREVRDEIRKAVTGSEGQGAGRVQEHPEHAKEDAGNADRQASVKQPSSLEELRRSKHNPDEPILPGMEPHLAAEKESIAAKQGEDLSREIAAPKESISAKAGEMERNSPLFRDTEASGQSGLFNGDKISDVPADKGAGSKPSATPQGQQAEIFPNTKVANDAGKPLTVYHGTDADFDEFSSVNDGANSKAFPQGKGIGYFFTEDPEFASVYGKNTKEANINIEKPFKMTKEEMGEQLNSIGGDALKKKLIAQGYDGIELEPKTEKIGRFNVTSPRNFIVFEPSQIKVLKTGVSPSAVPTKLSDTTSRPQSGGISLPKKGDTVTLADGREGTVQYVHPEMNIARVKTGDGKTVTVGLKSLKDRSGEAGFAKLDIPSAVSDLVKAAHEKVFAPTENRIARGVDDTLYQLGKQYDADVLRTIKLLKSVGPTTSPEDQEAIYHHKEDSSVHLNQRQQGTLDNVVQPLMDTNSEMRAKLNKAGVPMGTEDDGYIHRVVQGKNNPLERAMRGKGGTGKGNVLSKAASSLKGRRMFAAEDEDGKRVVIHRNGDTMTAFDNGSASEFAKDKPGLQVGDEFNSKDGQRWTLKQATTKEIEEHTGVRYYKNALANTVVDYLQLRRAERANDALEGMKADPEFKSLSFKPEHGEMPPDGWRTVNLPQFNGYYFEPHMAETLDRFADELRADPAGAMEKIGNLMTASLVLNPARHVYNIGNHWLVERGVTGNFNPLIWPRSAKAGIRAIKAVMTQNDDFVNALDHGAPMMSHRQDLRELHQHLVDSMLGFLQQHTDVAAKIAELGGHLNHADMLKGMYKLGQKMTWMSNDMFFLQSIYEKELGGMKFDDAAAETAKHIPDYRIPSRVLNSPGLSKFMNSHLLTVFSRYHYGVWKSYGQMLKEVAGPESSLKDRGKGLDHMLMLGLLTFVGYELWDKLLKHVTGDPKARMVRSGASAVPYLVNEIAKGNKPPEELIQGTFTPAVLPKTAAELAFNRDLYSGSRIYDRHDPAATIAHDVGKKTLGALGPSQQVEKAERSETPMRDFLAYQGGVTFPNTEVQSPAVRLMHEILRENMTLTPELQRQLDDKRARIQSGNLTQKERKTQLKKEALDELSYYLPHVARYSDVKKVFNAATPEEKEIIRPIMLKKAVNVMRNNPIEGEREGALHAFEER